MPTPADILALTARVARDPSLAHTTGELAVLAGWSSAHLHRAFHRVARETPRAWTQRVRLAVALSMLAERDRTVGSVAAKLGFGSHAAFTRAFRAAYGVAPSALRDVPTRHLEHAACLGLYHLSLDPRRPKMPYEVHVQQRSAQPVLFQRRTVAPSELQSAMAECLPAVFVHCQQHGIAMAGPPYTRYVEMSRGTFTIEAGIPVAAPAEGTDTICAGTLPAGDLATTVHTGPYDQLGEAHSALEAWAREHERTASGGPWESYLTDPGQTPDPADWKTEVVLPLA